MLLITYHGTVICTRDGGVELMHAPIGAVPQGWSPLYCARDGSDLSLRVPSTNIGITSFATECSTRGQAVVHLRKGGRYLRALPGGEIDMMASEASGWEQLLTLHPAAYDILSRLISSAWISETNKLIVRGALNVGESFYLHGFEGPIDLASLRFPFSLATRAGDRLHVFRGGWKITRLRRFRPLVYYSAFGSSRHLELLHLAIASFELMHPGIAEYLVFTDSRREDILNIIGDRLSERLTTVYGGSLDPLDYYLQRYQIYRVPGIEAYGPLLYLDTDVMASGDCTALLIKLLGTSLVEAGEEVFSPMASRESVGSHLTAADGVTPPWEYGFNSGSLGFASAEQHAATFQAIIDVTLRYADREGRDRLGGWYDQGPANYIAAKLGGFGTRLMTPYLRQVTPAGHVDGATPTLVHFWGTGEQKLTIMRNHLAALEAALNSPPE